MRKVLYTLIGIVVLLVTATIVARFTGKKHFVVNAWSEQRCPYNGELTSHYYGIPYTGGFIPNDSIIITCVHSPLYEWLFLMSNLSLAILVAVGYVYKVVTFYIKKIESSRLMKRIFFWVIAIAGGIMLLSVLGGSFLLFLIIFD